MNAGVDSVTPQEKKRKERGKGGKRGGRWNSLDPDAPASWPTPPALMNDAAITPGKKKGRKGKRMHSSPPFFRLSFWRAATRKSFWEKGERERKVK